MNRLKLLLLTLMVLLPVSAVAADLPAKKAAVIATPSGYQTASGFWWGLGAENDIANATVASQGAGTNLYADGAGLVGVIGANFKLPGVDWASWEAGFTYLSLGSTQTCAGGVSCSLTSNWDLETGISVSFPWTTPLSLFPSWANFFGGNPSTLLPPNVAITSSLPYIGAWVHADDVSSTVGAVRGSDWQFTPSGGIGLKNFIAGNGGVLDLRVEVEVPNSSFSIGPQATAKKGLTTLFKAVYEY